MSFKLCVCCALLCVAVAAYYIDEQDELLSATVEETQRVFAGVEQQLSVAMQMPELFALEDAQLQMFSLETQAKLVAIREEVKKEMDDAALEVENVRRAALDNVTTWKKKLQELQEATARNKQTLQSIREKKELEKQRERELEEVRRAEEKKKMEIQRAIEKKKEMEEHEELEKQIALEQLQALEKERLELEKRQKGLEVEQPQALLKEKERQRELQTVKSDEADDKESVRTVHRVLVWYVVVEQMLLSVWRDVYRQLVLPVVVILIFFALLTMGIGRYNAWRQAQRNRRVMYSGYPASYRRKEKQHDRRATAEGSKED